jgi:signal transduction histidine kinase
MTAAVLIYFLFANRYLRAEARLTSLMTLVSPVVVAANLLIIWTGNNFSGDQSPVVSGTGNIVFILLTAYAAAALWAILISRTENAARFRAAGLIVIAACASPLLLPEGLFAAALLLMTAAVAWIGWLVVRAQMVTPLEELREELRLANRDLRQAASEAANFRTRNEVLTQQLQAAGQYRSDFLDKLGHKLRTPLNSITGYTELLESGLYGDLNEKQVDRLTKIQRNGEILLELINNMLDLNKINAGRMELNLTTFSLDTLIDQVRSALEPRRAEKGLRLTIELDPELPPIYGDELRICQVITQMVENALKFTMEGEVTVHCRRIQVQKGTSAQFTLPVIGWLTDGDWIVIEVNDTGIGIAPEEQSKIFEEFHQVSDPRAEEFMGTGLGLAIAKRLVELHEGAIWLKSALDQGSKFYMALRVQQKVADAP